MKNNCLIVLILLSLGTTCLSAQEAYIDEKIFGKYVESGYANKKFMPSGKTDKDNLKQGKWTDYVFSERTVFIKNGSSWDEKEGIFLLKCKGEFRDDKKTGVWKYCLIEEPSGKEIPFFETTFTSGLQNGLFRSFYPSGKRSLEGNYIDGSADGIITGYFESGQKKFETRCINGSREGEGRSFYKNGALANVTSFRNDSLDGKQTRYYADGKIQEISNCKAGATDGLYQYYYDNGQLWTERLYANDKLIQVNALKDRSGKDLERGTFENGNGYLYFYDESGKPYSKNVFKDGKVISEEHYSTEPDWYKRD